MMLWKVIFVVGCCVIFVEGSARRNSKFARQKDEEVNEEEKSERDKSKFFS